MNTKENFTIVSQCEPEVPVSYSLDRGPSAHFYEHICGQPQRYIPVRQGVTLYLSDPSPTSTDTVNSLGMNDKITTIIVPPNTKTTVCADRGFSQGQNTQKCRTLTGPRTYDMRSLKYDDGSTGMNDNISEIRVEPLTAHTSFTLACCAGERDASECANLSDPHGVDCKRRMEQYCRESKANFYSDRCKRWMRNVPDGVKNDIARDMCSQAATDTEKEWCACFSAQLPAEWVNDPVKRALFRCLDPKCQGGNNPNALRPYGLECPTTYVDCQQQDIKLKLIESGIDRATIEQNCGNLNVGSPPPPVGSPPPPAGSPPMPSGSPAPSPSGASKSNLPVILGISGGALALIIVVIIIMATAAKKRTK